MTGIRITAASALVAGLAILSGCSGTSTPVGTPALPSMHGSSPMRTLPSFYSCPAHGSLKYVSDYNNNVIDVYFGNFNGQAPCAVLTSHVRAPWGMSVDA